MAANICVLEMKTSIGTIVDFDEIMVPKLGFPSIFNYSKQNLIENTGALEFEMARIQLDLNSKNTLFERKSIQNPKLIDSSGPCKLIFKTSAVGVILTHSIRKYIGKTDKTRVINDELMLHYRYSGGTENENKSRDFSIFLTDFDGHMRMMERVIEDVFGETVPVFNPEIIIELNKCINEIRATKICRSAVTQCRERMMLLADWEFESSSGVFVTIETSR
uniref:Glycosyltransferase family 92 protein n=1 Tax=Caenorhabditis tropicalis TaxID=1561998 RepID=A0A1I7V1X5_9PELO